MFINLYNKTQRCSIMFVKNYLVLWGNVPPCPSFESTPEYIILNTNITTLYDSIVYLVYWLNILTIEVLSRYLLYVFYIISFYVLSFYCVWLIRHLMLQYSINHWLTGWLVGWLVDWLIDWLIDWLTDWLISNCSRVITLTNKQTDSRHYYNFRSEPCNNPASVLCTWPSGRRYTCVSGNKVTYHSLVLKDMNAGGSPYNFRSEFPLHTTTLPECCRPDLLVEDTPACQWIKLYIIVLYWKEWIMGATTYNFCS